MLLRGRWIVEISSKCPREWLLLLDSDCEQVSMWLAEEAENMYLSDQFVSQTQESRAIAQTGTNKSKNKPCRSHLNLQSKYEQSADYIFSIVSGSKPLLPFARNHRVYRHVLLGICCLSQCFLYNCQRETTSGNDKHAVVDLEVSVL